MTEQLRRGFKKDAKELANEVRSELNLRLTDPINPWSLAEHLEIPVEPLSTFKETAPIAYRHFVEDAEGRSEFSALTIFDGPRRMIVNNDAHSRKRQASDLGHELSHAILHHVPYQALDERGLRHWDGVIEKEADWLCGCILIPEEAALHIARKGLTVDQASDFFQVSSQMVRMRLNLTAANRRVSYFGRSVVKKHIESV